MQLLLTHQETERLHFRLVEKSDFDAWLPLFDEKETAGFLGLDHTKSKEKLAQKFFDKVFHRYENNLGGMNALIDKASGKLVGQCGLLIQTIEGKEYIEIGYAVLPEYAGMGYATEAAKKCRDYAFENNLTHRIISIINTDNYSSMAVAKKNGMEIERHIPDYHGSSINLWSISKEQWTKTND